MNIDKINAPFEYKKIYAQLYGFILTFFWLKNEAKKI